MNLRTLIGALLLWVLWQPTALSQIAPSSHCVINRQGNRKPEAQCFARRTVEGERTFQLYAPPGQWRDLALVLVLHGGGGSGRNMEWLTQQGFNRIADREGALVVYPDGIGKGWNDGRSDLRSKATRDRVDDVAFLVGLVRALAADYPVDSRRVYATGISNGGLMSYRLACDAADVFAAVAPVAANLSVEFARQCHPARPIPIAIFSGVDDPIMPWAGGAVSVLGMRRGAVVSALETFEKWRALEGCADVRVTLLPDSDPEDGTRIALHTATDCDAEAQVRLYEIRGGGHTWPRGVPYLGSRLVGKVSRDLDADEEIWSLFRRYLLQR